MVNHARRKGFVLGASQNAPCSSVTLLELLVNWSANLPIAGGIYLYTTLTDNFTCWLTNGKCMFLCSCIVASNQCLPFSTDDARWSRFVQPYHLWLVAWYSRHRTILPFLTKMHDEAFVAKDIPWRGSSGIYPRFVAERTRPLINRQLLIFIQKFGWWKWRRWNRQDYSLLRVVSFVRWLSFRLSPFTSNPPTTA